MNRWLTMAIAAAALALGVGVTLVYTSSVAKGLGSPPELRDRNQMIALFAVAGKIHDRYGGERQHPLPSRIALAAPYAYRNLGNGDYELCAVFERRGSTGRQVHDKGRSCFRFSVYDRPWIGPLEKPWFDLGCL